MQKKIEDLYPSYMLASESDSIIDDWKSNWQWREDACDLLRNVLRTIGQNDVTLGVCMMS